MATLMLVSWDAIGCVRFASKGGPDAVGDWWLTGYSQRLVAERILSETGYSQRLVADQGFQVLL